MNGKPGGIVQAPDEGYDANIEVKKIQKYKPAPGVKFVEYDEYGMNKKEGLSKYISTDNSIPDVFIEAPPEMLEKAMMRPRGVFRDYDKDTKEMNAEGKIDYLSYTIIQKELYLIVLLIQIKITMHTRNWRMILSSKSMKTNQHLYQQKQRKNGKIRKRIVILRIKESKFLKISLNKMRPKQPLMSIV